MDVGKLDHRVTLVTYTETQQVDGSGTYPVFADIKTVWAQVTPMKGLVRFDTKQIGEEITHRVIIRYYPNTSSEWWIRYKNRHLRIRSVTNLGEDNRFIELLCRETGDLNDDFETNIDAAGDPI